MDNPVKPKSGRPAKDEVADEILALLQSEKKRAWTLGEIVPEVDASRRTVKDRLDDLIERPEVGHEKIGNATGYWAESPQTADGGYYTMFVNGLQVAAGGFIDLSGDDYLEEYGVNVYRLLVILGVLSLALAFMAYPAPIMTAISAITALLLFGVAAHMLHRVNVSTNEEEIGYH